MKPALVGQPWCKASIHSGPAVSQLPMATKPGLKREQWQLSGASDDTDTEGHSPGPLPLSY